MQMQTKVGLAIGVGAGAIVAGGLATALSAARRDDGTSHGDDPLPYPDPVPGGGTSPGDEPVHAAFTGRIDPSGWWDDHRVDGEVVNGQLTARIDPRGWGGDIRLDGRVDHSGFDTRIDPRGWGNDTAVRGARTATGFDGSVDRPGLWNDVRHRITETVRGAQVIREGRFDETLTPGFAEATWRSSPNGSAGDSRVLEFDPPGWANATRVDLHGTVPAGVEATIAAHLFDVWKTEQERQADYPDPDHPDPTGPGDDYPTAPGYPTGPGDGYPTGPGDDYPVL